MSLLYLLDSFLHWTCFDKSPTYPCYCFSPALSATKTALNRSVNLLLSPFPVEIGLPANQPSLHFVTSSYRLNVWYESRVNPGPSPGRKGTLPLAQAEMKTEQRQLLTGCSTKQHSDWLSQQTQMQTLGWSRKRLFHWFSWVTWCHVSRAITRYYLEMCVFTEGAVSIVSIKGGFFSIEKRESRTLKTE